MHNADAELLRDEFRDGSSDDIKRRRGIAGLSIFSTCMLGAIGLYQIGVLRRLPPHTRLFDPEAVHGSRDGYSMLVAAPDAVLGMASYAATACLAAIGDTNRPRALNVAMAGKCTLDAILSSVLAVKQWRRFRTFSPWSLFVFTATCASLYLARPQSNSQFSE